MSWLILFLLLGTACANEDRDLGGRQNSAVHSKQSTTTVTILGASSTLKTKVASAKLKVKKVESLQPDALANEITQQCVEVHSATASAHADIFTSNDLYVTVKWGAHGVLERTTVALNSGLRATWSQPFHRFCVNVTSSSNFDNLLVISLYDHDAGIKSLFKQDDRIGETIILSPTIPCELCTIPLDWNVDGSPTGTITLTTTTTTTHSLPAQTTVSPVTATSSLLEVEEVGDTHGDSQYLRTSQENKGGPPGEDKQDKQDKQDMKDDNDEQNGQDKQDMNDDNDEQNGLPSSPPQRTEVVIHSDTLAAETQENTKEENKETLLRVGVNLKQSGPTLKQASAEQLQKFCELTAANSSDTDKCTETAKNASPEAVEELIELTESNDDERSGVQNPSELKAGDLLSEMEGNYVSHWTVSQTAARPDGYPRNIISVKHEHLHQGKKNTAAKGPADDRQVVHSENAPLPGPTITVRQGKRVRITVHNQLSDTMTSIHFHGLHQTQQNWADGVPGVTECGIPPHSTTVIDFVVDQEPGTHWYHSHSGAQFGDGMSGAFIILPKEVSKDQLNEQTKEGKRALVLYKEYKQALITKNDAKDPCSILNKSPVLCCMAAEDADCFWHDGTEECVSTPRVWDPYKNHDKEGDKEGYNPRVEYNNRCDLLGNTNETLEYPVLIQDWHHEEYHTMVSKYMSRINVFPGFMPDYPMWTPHSILLNGMGQFNCDWFITEEDCVDIRKFGLRHMKFKKLHPDLDCPESLSDCCSSDECFCDSTELDSTTDSTKKLHVIKKKDDCDETICTFDNVAKLCRTSPQVSSDQLLLPWSKEAAANKTQDPFVCLKTWKKCKKNKKLHKSDKCAEGTTLDDPEYEKCEKEMLTPDEGYPTKHVGQCAPSREPYMGACTTPKETDAAQFICHPHKKVRLRLINGGAGVPLRIWVDDHDLTVVARDGLSVRPSGPHKAVLMPLGSRMDVILQCKDDKKHGVSFKVFAQLSSEYYTAGTKYSKATHWGSPYELPFSYGLLTYRTDEKLGALKADELKVQKGKILPENFHNPKDDRGDPLGHPLGSYLAHHSVPGFSQDETLTINDIQLSTLEFDFVPPESQQHAPPAKQTSRQIHVMNMGNYWDPVPGCFFPKDDIKSGKIPEKCKNMKTGHNYGKKLEWWSINGHMPLSGPHNLPLLHGVGLDNLPLSNDDLYGDDSPDPAFDSDMQSRHPFVLSLELGTWQEIILINYEYQQHPWHLHGMTMYITGRGYFSDPTDQNVNVKSVWKPWKESTLLDSIGFDGNEKENASPKLNYAKAREKYNIPKWNEKAKVLARGDSFTVPGKSFIVFRVKAVNPGFWLMHCHMEYHLKAGMGLVVQVSKEGKIPWCEETKNGEVHGKHCILKPPHTSNYQLCGSRTVFNTILKKSNWNMEYAKSEEIKCDKKSDAHAIDMPSDLKACPE